MSEREIEGKLARKRFIDELNISLETDHEKIKKVLLHEVDVKDMQKMIDAGVAYDSGGKKVVNALTIIGWTLCEQPIMPVFEGDLIQWFE